MKLLKSGLFTLLVSGTTMFVMAESNDPVVQEEAQVVTAENVPDEEGGLDAFIRVFSGEITDPDDVMTEVLSHPALSIENGNTVNNPADDAPEVSNDMQDTIIEETVLTHTIHFEAKTIKLPAHTVFLRADNLELKGEIHGVEFDIAIGRTN